MKLFVPVIAAVVGLTGLCHADESARPKPIVIAGAFPDNGGALQVYYERYQTYVAAGATFRIDGVPLSLHSCARLG